MSTTQEEQNGNGGQGGLLGTLQGLDEEQLARGLGWFSLGLGLAEFLAPRGVARVAGVRGNTGLIRLMGLREIAHGVAIFSQGRRPAGAVWSRVVGDALDLVALGAAFASPRSDKGRLTFATANVLAVTVLDVLCAQQLSRHGGRDAGGSVRVSKSITVNRPPEEVYQFWRDFENLPRFMYHLESVKVTGEGRSHWAAKGPAGTSVEWDAQTTADEPGRLIAWRSVEGSDVENSGRVRFQRAAGGRGTIIRVELEYTPPGGVLGAGLAMLFGEEPSQQLQDDLRRFKQVIETGEVVRSEGSLQGPGHGAVTQLPAHPPAGGGGQ